MKVIFLRHGETELNRDKIIQGWSDAYLTEKGEEQIQEASERLKNIKIDYIFSSPLGRAMTTARAIKKHHNVKFSSSSFIMEYSMGIHEGESIETEKWQKERIDYYLNGYQFEKGESLKIFQKRILYFLSSLLEKENTKDKDCILAVTHGGLIHGLLLLNAKDDDEKRKIISSIIENTATIQLKLFKENKKLNWKFINFDDLPKKK